MVNHIYNCNLFTNKLNLISNLQSYEKLQLQNPNRGANFIPLEEYVPLTYKLDDKCDRERYFQTVNSNKFRVKALD